jgi:hypothetical protein
MQLDEALAFLAQHQPMPPDKALSEDLMKRYEEVRRFFLQYPDTRCVGLFLGSFGDGGGHGVYQVVEDVIALHPKEIVIRALDTTLASPHKGVRYWSLQIALSYPDRTLARHFLRLLSSTDPDERQWAASNLEAVASVEDESLVRKALASESNDEVRQILAGVLEKSSKPKS